MLKEHEQEMERRRDVCLAILRKKRKNQAALVEEYIAEAEHMEGHRYWSDHFYRDCTIRGNDLLGDFDTFVEIRLESEREAADLAKLEAMVPQYENDLNAVPAPPYIIKVETTVFIGPGKAEVEIITLTGRDAEYLHEEVLAGLAWADEVLSAGGCSTDLSLVPMADDYIIIESFGGMAGNIAGVIKVYSLDTNICPGGDGYGN